MKRTYLYSLLCVALMAVIAVAYFYPDDIDGRVLEQNDIRQGLANGQEAKAFHESTGETTRWTNALCGGMPTFQIAPSYASAPLLNWIAKAYSLWLPSPANLLFIMMLGFFIMGLCMKMRWYVALFGAIAWAFSSYFIIIIGAGHIWKFVTLAYIPPTLGGIFLCYRGKYMGGAALAALFGALQLLNNHIQMSYYFLFVVLAIMIAACVRAVRNGTVGSWVKGSACILGAGILAVAANSANLYNTAQYSKETVRGKATYLTSGDKVSKDGADFDFITQWSYGFDETLTLLVPNAKGGATIKPVGSVSQPMRVTDTKAAADSQLSAEEMSFVGQFMQYFGDQPMTNGPVYVGFVVLLLAFMSIGLCRRSALMWALWAVTLLAWMLSLGHNFEWFSRLFVDYFPGYNRFRTVSSILVVVEFTLPLLAMMTLKRIMDMRGSGALKADAALTGEEAHLSRVTLWTGGVMCAVCVITWLFPSVMGSGLSINEIEQLREADVIDDPVYSGVINEIKRLRLSLVSADALRSLIIGLIATLCMWLYSRRKIKSTPALAGIMTALCLVDLYAVDKRYVNSENFVDPLPAEQSFEMNDADRQILQDPDPNYRVYDVDDFGGARSSFFHKTVGGYHAAKLTRYNDLLEHQISKGNMNVLNMLNTKYFMAKARDEQNQPVADMEGNPMWVAERNPDALGHAWWVNAVSYMPDANAEMAALDTLDTRAYAVADRSFEAVLGKVSAVDSTASVRLVKYAPNKIDYLTHSSHPGVVVFSEIYFPWGWTATIDGKVAPIARANYALRALRVPAGEHKIVFEFDPKSLDVTNSISVCAIAVIYLLCAVALAGWGWSLIRRRKGGA